MLKMFKTEKQDPQTCKVGHNRCDGRLVSRCGFALRERLPVPAHCVLVGLCLVLSQLPSVASAQADVTVATRLLSHATVSVQEMSSETVQQTAAPRPLPDWIEKGNFVDAAGTEFVLITSDRFFSELESRRDLRDRAIEVLRGKLDDLIAPGAGRAVIIDDELVKRITVPGHQHVVVHPVDEFQDLPEGLRTMYTCYTQLQLDDEFVSWANTAWEDQLVKSRVLQTTLIGALIVGLLGVAFAYFHLDRATRGYYSGRLQTTCLALVILIIAVGLAASRAFLWI